MSISSVSKNKPRRAVTCFYPEDGGGMLLQNVSSISTDHTAIPPLPSTSSWHSA
jgi:hypothetical protein